MSKSLVVTIESGIFDTLQMSNYVLCIAKKVNNVYTVVWQSKQGQKLFQNNTFSWTPNYQVFANNTFENGMKVDTVTDAQSIQGGESCQLTATGRMLSATGQVVASEPFSIVNDFGLYHPGVSAALGNGNFAPIYVSETPVIKGITSLMPIENIMVWFQQNVTTSTMISNTMGNSKELDYTGVKTHSISYSNEQLWTSNSLNANTLLLLPSGTMDSALVVDGVLEYLVQLSPMIQVAIQATLVAYIVHKLAQSGTPGKVSMSSGGCSLVIEFSKQRAFSHILTKHTMPDYHKEIEDTLTTARSAGKMPDCEEWHIKPQVSSYRHSKPMKEIRDVLTDMHPAACNPVNGSKKPVELSFGCDDKPE